MILYEQPPCEELIPYYRPGGYHPVHLGDTFHDDTYQVVHKLGYGQYSTVWLVEDRKRGRYASLKILTATAPTSEVDVMRHIQRNGSASSGSEFILQLIDEFEHTGPNGVHRCIISDVLGPPLSSDIEELYPDEEYPIGMAKRISSQIARGLEYLHSQGVVHGGMTFTYQYFVCLMERITDLHLKNILFHSPSITSWSSQEEVYKYLEPPGRCGVILRGAKEPAPFSPHVPAYIVATPDPTSLLKLCLSDPLQVNIRICDFGESFIYSPGIRIRRKLHTPAVYSAPEILLDDDPSPASDVWACAVLVYFLVSARSFLFPSYRGISNEVLRSMTLLLGRLPEYLWLKWADRGQYFDESGHWVAGPKSLSRFGRACSGRLNEQQKISFESMIRKMVAYNPRERATMAEVVELIPDTWLLVDAGEVGTKVHSAPIRIVLPD